MKVVHVETKKLVKLVVADTLVDVAAVAVAGAVGGWAAALTVACVIGGVEALTLAVLHKYVKVSVVR